MFGNRFDFFGKNHIPVETRVYDGENAKNWFWIYSKPEEISTYFLLFFKIDAAFFIRVVLSPALTDPGSGVMSKFPLNLGHFHLSDSHSCDELFRHYSTLKVIAQNGRITELQFLSIPVVLLSSPSYHPSFVWFFAPEKSGQLFHVPWRHASFCFLDSPMSGFGSPESRRK